MISENLWPHVKSILGVDISQNSVDRYNALAAMLGCAPEEMHAICKELKGEPGELNGAQFDLIVVRAVLSPPISLVGLHICVVPHTCCCNTRCNVIRRLSQDDAYTRTRSQSKYVP